MSRRARVRQPTRTGVGTLRHAKLALLLAAAILGARNIAASTTGDARVTFLVEPPASTPAGATLWVSGDSPFLGDWSGKGLELAPRGDGRHAGTARLPFGVRIAYKVTRGSWETVEKDALGGEIVNRTCVPAGDDTIRIRVAAWRDQGESKSARASTLTGTIRRHEAFPSKHVRARDVLVYLPPRYAADSTRRYPVLYFQDGNNVFDAATSFAGVEWGADETAERLIAAGELPAVILVAIANTPDRMAEYTPAADPRHGGGRAAGYARFLIEELMPFVDRTYRTRTEPASTGVVGSSLGGIVSLYLGLEHPERFGLVGCVSPAAWWADRDIVRRAARAGADSTRLRVWLDIGTAEGGSGGKTLGDARALRGALVKAGYREGVDLHYEEVEGGEHNERAWAARTDRMLRFLLGAMFADSD